MLKRSKLLAPSAGGGVERERLLRRLEAGLSICLLTAPAGFGKSTLAADWLLQCAGDRCWLSLDASDRNGPTLWESLIECLRQARPAFGLAALTLLQQREMTLDGLVDSLALDLAQWRQAEPAGRLHLVLDDLHCLEDGANLPALLNLLRHLAGWARVVLTSRSLAFLAQQTAMTAAQVDVIDQHQLAFDAQELETLTQSRSLNVPADVQRKLLARTEGWITPIHLILCQMRNDGVTRQWNDAWLEGQTFTLTPLIRDHYDSQLASTRDLLALLALVPQFDRTLVAALAQLAGVGGGGLDALCTDTFIIRLQQPGWWKIHDLYRVHLQERFAALPTQLQQQVVESVADWQCQHGAHAQALVLQAQYAEDVRLHRYLLRHYHGWLQQGLHDLLEQAASLLTDAQVQTDPHLCALFLWARADRLELAACRAHVTRALEQVQHRNLPADLQVELYSVLSYCEQVKDDPICALANAQHALDICERAIHLAQSAQLTQPIQTPPPKRSRALLTIGVLTYMQGDMGAASAALARSMVSAQDERHYFHALISLGYRMAALHLAGQFDEALAISDRIRQWLQTRPDMRSMELWLDLPSLDILITRDALDDVQQRLQPLLRFAEHAAPSLRTAFIYFSAMRFHYYRGDLHTSLEYLSRVEAAQEKLTLNWNWGWASTAAWRRRIALRQHRRQEVQQWFSANPIPVADDIPFHQEEERLLDASVLAQIGELDRAEALASLIARQSEQQARRLHQLQALIVLGNVASLRDEFKPNPAAVAAEALTDLLGAHCILRSEALWQKGVQKVSQKDAPARVLVAEPADEAATASESSTGISRRERAVLVLLAQGKSNAEIATLLHISDNTVKTHMKNILRKLDARNRIEALVLAREQGIL